ncbi:VgrG-related protein [Kitasatospora sp. NPDC004240]
MSTGNNTNTFVLGCPGPLPPPWAEQPKEVHVQESGGLPASAVVRVLDPYRRLLEQSGITIGRPFTVRARGEGGALLPLFTGEVIALEAEFDGDGSWTTVRALDLSHRLQRGRRVRGFRDRRASEVVRELAQAAGVRLGQVDATATTYEYLTQPNVSDWEFLRTLALENGRELVMLDGLLHFRDPVPAAAAPGPGTRAEQSPFVLELGANVLAVRAAVSSVGQVNRVEVRGWDVAAKRPVESVVAVAPSTELRFGSTPAEALAAFPPATLLVADVPYRTDAEAVAVSAALAADQAAALGELEITVRGEPRLRVGSPVAVSGAGTPFDGKYTVTSAVHVDHGLGYETRLTVSGRQDRGLFGLASGASAAARSPRVPSVATGVVVDVMRAGGLPRDGYGGQEEQGWVRLGFPWLSDGAPGGEAYVSDWCRTVQWGGVGGGGVVCPDVGDEVLVGFEQGLLDRPYVIGGLYNGRDRPSPERSALTDGYGRVNRRSVASRAGDRIELLDSAVQERGVRLRTADDKLVLHLDRQRTAVTISSDGTVDIRSAGRVTVHGDGVELDAGAGELKLSGRSVSIRGTTDVTVRATTINLN